MENVVAWVSANWQTILAVYGGVVLAATAIVRATPSTRDDEILAKVIKFLDWFSTVNPKPPKAP